MSRRKNGGLFLAVYLLAATPALAETSREAGRGGCSSPCSDVLRRDDGRPAQMRGSSAKVACGCSDLVGAGHPREA